MRRKVYIALLGILVFSGSYLHGQTYIKYQRSPVSTNNYNEFAPVIFNDGIVYSSDRIWSSFKQYTGNQGPIINIYYAPQRENNKLGSSTLFSEQLQNNNLNDGPASFSGDGRLAVFSRNFDSNQNFGLFFADSTEAGWGNIREFPYNDPGSKATDPFLDSTGTILYFASNREGGFGGFDIYVSYFQSGSWTSPQNLGPVINSSKNEVYPYIHPTGRLYFSSNGHDRRRDYDLYYSEFYDRKWINPVKLPAPFNSGRNDFTYYAARDFSSGYFTSDRRGSLDIFSFNFTVPSFEVCKKQVKDNFCYVFYEENTVTLDTTLYVYEWDLGDNSKVRAKEAEHCYSGPGDYMVQLNVIDKLTGDVQFNQAEYLVEVKKTIQSFIDCPDTLKVNAGVSMNGLESYFGDAVPGEYYWDFGDGSRDVGASVTHTYAAPGVYKIKLGVIEESADAETARRFCSYKTIVVEE